MKRCPRCETKKPDGCFEERSERFVHAVLKVFLECLNCRTLRSEMGMLVKRKKTSPPPSPPEEKEIVPGSPEWVFREELEKFKKRGSPVIERPYVKTVGGTPVKKRVGRD